MLDNQTKPKSVFTTSYQYGDHNEEYVFACKGRPFAALVSDILPTPDTNLIDHNLVRELGLKMTNLQCRKFHFAGHKMRALGRVSTAVQCIQDGRTNGGFHLKGLVVTNLDQFLDTQVIVGAKMRGNIRKMSSKRFNERKCSTGDSDDVYSDSDVSTGLVGDAYACYASDSDDSVVSTQALEDSLLAPDSTTARVDSVFSSSMMSSSTVSPPTVTSATMSSHVLPSSSSTTSTARSSVTSAWVYPFLLGAYRYHDGAEYGGKIIKQCDKDGKPRITNISDGLSRALGLHSNKVRVGMWENLDNKDHETRHAVLADLRKADPDRVCQLCSYLLLHKCSLTDFGAPLHCKDCCNIASELHHKTAAEKYKEALKRM